jgi:hypothetical protein
MTAPILRADILVTASDGKTQLVVEIRRNQGKDIEEVAQTFRERIRRYVPDSFFLFVATRQFWLWTPASSTPAYQGDTAVLLGRYANLEKIPLVMFDEQEFYQLVYSWLGSVTFKSAEALRQMPGQAWLVDTGLQPLIYRGYIQREAVIEG